MEPTKERRVDLKVKRTYLNYYEKELQDGRKVKEPTVVLYALVNGEQKKIYLNSTDLYFAALRKEEYKLDNPKPQ